MAKPNFQNNKEIRRIIKDNKHLPAVHIQAIIFDTLALYPSLTTIRRLKEIII